MNFELGTQLANGFVFSSVALRWSQSSSGYVDSFPLWPDAGIQDMSP
ncbi:mCG146922 [Mus musculus]|nr:mCG146922 [Mus musculus]